MAVFVAAGCRSHYVLDEIVHSRLVVDNRYDATPDTVAARFLEPYTAKIDSVMSPVVGEVDCNLDMDRPDGALPNLMADIFVEAAADFGELPVLGVYNSGGVRAELLKGRVTYGDLLNMAPFDNTLCFVTLTGAQLMELFGQVAAIGGAGLSQGAELVISPDYRLLSARLHGQPIEAEKVYRVVTTNYLTEGNDGLTAFRRATAVSSPGSEASHTRRIIVDYFKRRYEKGRPVGGRLKGRIRMEKDNIRVL